MARRSLDSTVAALHWLCNYPEDARVGDYFVAGELADNEFGRAAQQIIGAGEQLTDCFQYSVQSLIRAAEKQLGLA